MALTMVHLLAADLWARRHAEYLDCPEFYLGAISPDAIHIRYHGDKSRKDEFHLYNWRSLHREPLLDYWRERRGPFDIGYGVHVLTDCQWVQSYIRAFPAIIRPDGRLNVDVYYNDTFVTDFRLYNSQPRLQALMALLMEAEAPADHPLLTRDEFTQWRQLMADAYRAPCPKNDPVRFIDRPYVESFARRCQPLIDELYEEAFGGNMLGMRPTNSDIGH